MYGIVTYPCIKGGLRHAHWTTRREAPRQRRIECAVRVMEIATGIRQEEYVEPDKAKRRETADKESRTLNQS